MSDTIGRHCRDVERLFSARLRMWTVGSGAGRFLIQSTHRMGKIDRIWFLKVRLGEHSAFFFKPCLVTPTVFFGSGRRNIRPSREDTLGRFFATRDPATSSEFGVLFFFFRHFLETRKCPQNCHLINCYASLYVSSGEPTLAADVRHITSRMLRNYGDAVAHDSTHDTQRTRTYQHQQLAQQSNAPHNQSRTSHSLEQGEDGVLPGASRMPD